MRQVAVLLSCTFVTIAPSLAADDWATCTIGPMNERVLVACSRVVEAGKLDNRELATAYRRRGSAYQWAGDIDRAIADYGQAIRLDQSDAIAFMLRAGAHNARGESDQAIRDFSEAIRLNPALTRALNNRGLLYVRKGDYARGIRDYDQAIRLNATDPVPFMNRALAHAGKKDFNRAFADFDEAIRLDPNFAETFRSRASAYHLKGEFDHAIKDLTRAIKLDPNNPAFFNDRGVAHVSQSKEMDQALEGTPAAIRRQMSGGIGSVIKGDDVLLYHVEACSGKAILVDRDGGKTNYDLAIEDFTQAINLDVNFVFAYANRANAYAVKCDYAGAIRDYDQAIRLNPRIARWRYERGLVKLSNGDKVGGRADVAAAKAMDPELGK